MESHAGEMSSLPGSWSITLLVAFGAGLNGLVYRGGIRDMLVGGSAALANRLCPSPKLYPPLARSLWMLASIHGGITTNCGPLFMLVRM
jgi:hypothetical protein